jgi:hypothetical protein
MLKKRGVGQGNADFAALLRAHEGLGAGCELLKADD